MLGPPPLPSSDSERVGLSGSVSTGAAGASVRVGERPQTVSNAALTALEPAASRSRRRSGDSPTSRSSAAVVDAGAADVGTSGVDETPAAPGGGVTAADAKALKEHIDKTTINAIAKVPALELPGLAMGAMPKKAYFPAATLGRVKYPAIAPGETGTVLIYVGHR